MKNYFFLKINTILGLPCGGTSVAVTSAVCQGCVTDGRVSEVLTSVIPTLWQYELQGGSDTNSMNLSHN
jgi:hypothetical protein